MFQLAIPEKSQIKILPESALAMLMDKARIIRECMFCRRTNENNTYFERHYLIRPVHLDLNLRNNHLQNLAWMCEFHRLSYMAYMQGRKLRGKRVTKESFNV